MIEVLIVAATAHEARVWALEHGYGPGQAGLVTQWSNLLGIRRTPVVVVGDWSRLMGGKMADLIREELAYLTAVGVPVSTA